jgi:hypothetical protein
MSLHIPKEHHETVKPFLKQDLDLSVKLEKGSLIITLTPVKTFRHAANTPEKTRPKTTRAMVRQRQASDSV